MILILFSFFVALSLILIVLGLSKPSESAQALIGFAFLFLLAMVVIGGNLEYKTGELINQTYADGNLIAESTSYSYTSYEDNTGIFTAHRFGYFLAVASIIGFVGVLVGLKGGWKRE